MHVPTRYTAPPTAWVFDVVSSRLLGRVVLRRGDLNELEAIARICLQAKRHGHRPALRGAPPDFTGLLDATGLIAALGGQDTSVNRSGNPNSANHSGPPM